MLELDREAVATGLGYASIGCWLCAQLPQVIKNWQLGSCDGLSFPFLTTWLFGDLTNLIGCILTDQLPFQTYLATYFCIVDFTLVGQYFYYTPRQAAAPAVPIKQHGSPSAVRPTLQRVRSHPPTIGSPLQSHGMVRPSSGRGRRRGPPPVVNAHTHAVTESPVFGPPADSVEALYAAALDVARAAERISLRRSHSSRQRPRHGTTAPPNASSDRLMDSFHSEVSLPASSTEDEDEHAHHRMAQSTPFLDHGRGRSLTRLDAAGTATPPTELADTLENLPDSQIIEIRRPTRSSSRSQSAARTRGSSRRAATMAFMSFGLLFWHGSGMRRGASGEGHVILPEQVTSDSALASASSWPNTVHPLPLPFPRQTEMLLLNLAPEQPGNHTKPNHPKHPPEPPVSLQEAIGRVSAWCCTTLYLSSRLPQIWKNFQRKSIEGLSILLFVFAFLGNVLYVLSIVLAPMDGKTSYYLLRALPYLLGSGGTLVFDLTIMIQALIRAFSYGALTLPLSRRRTRHAEDGLYGNVPGERRPLLASASPHRAATEPVRDAGRKGSAASASTQGEYTTSPIQETNEPGALGVRLYGDGPGP